MKIFLQLCLGSDLHLFKVGNNSGKFEIKEVEGHYVASIYWKKKLIHKFQKSSATERLKRFRNIYFKDKVYVLYGFNKGAHGEFVEVWKFPDSVKVWSFNSIWPIEITQDNNSFKIKYFDESNNPLKNNGKEISFP
jgi:hypothetical protein